MSDSGQQPHKLEKVDFFAIHSPLLAYRSDIVSQSGEDGIIKRIFEILKPGNSYCLEFGAWDGKYLSNSWNLVVNSGWSGCFIEGNEAKYKDLLETHGKNEKVRCVQRFVDFDGPNSLDNILEEVNAPNDLDFVSIDVDGTDYFVWESLKIFRPNVLVIEFNPSIPNDVIFVQEKSNKINQGCSLLSLILLGKEKGYELICCTTGNAFFVKKEFYDLFGIPDNFINWMYKPLCDGRIFCGYDSYIYVAGMPRLIWSNIAVDSEDFQVLPMAMRRFDDSQRS